MQDAARALRTQLVPQRLQAAGEVVVACLRKRRSRWRAAAGTAAAPLRAEDGATSAMAMNSGACGDALRGDVLQLCREVVAAVGCGEGGECKSQGDLLADHCAALGCWPCLHNLGEGDRAKLDHFCRSQLVRPCRHH